MANIHVDLIMRRLDEALHLISGDAKGCTLFAVREDFVTEDDKIDIAAKLDVIKKEIVDLQKVLDG